MNDTIWIGNALIGSRLVVGTDIDRSEPAWVAIEEGRVPTGDELPIRLYAKTHEEKFSTLPDLFSGGGGYKVLPKLADVLCSFDLGGAQLLPARLYRYDRMTEIKREVYLLMQFARIKATAMEESRFKPPHQSRHFPKDLPPPKIRYFPYDLDDDDIAAMASPSELPDLWHDPRVNKSLFFSHRLVEALHDAGYAKLFTFIRCRQIRPSCPTS